MRDAPIGSIGVNLVALELSSFFRRRIDNNPATGINFHCHLEGGFTSMPEKLHQHFDHVFIGVIVVIPQDDVKARDVDGTRFLDSLFFSFWQWCAKTDRVLPKREFLRYKRHTGTDRFGVMDSSSDAEQPVAARKREF